MIPEKDVMNEFLIKLNNVGPGRGITRKNNGGGLGLNIIPDPLKMHNSSDLVHFKLKFED